jgi:hypothetical protein
MNLQEGTRRLALLLGIIGVIVSCFVSYSEFGSIGNQNARHAEFERLTAGFADSKLAQRIRQEAENDPSENSIMPGCCGIDEIVWDKNHVFNHPSGIYSVTTDGGQILYPTPAPSAGSYFLVAILPLLGFFIPWGAIRALGWVVAGFVASPK